MAFLLTGWTHHLFHQEAIALPMIPLTALRLILDTLAIHRLISVILHLFMTTGDILHQITEILVTPRHITEIKGILRPTLIIRGTLLHITEIPGIRHLNMEMQDIHHPILEILGILLFKGVLQSIKETLAIHLYLLEILVHRQSLTEMQGIHHYHSQTRVCFIKQFSLNISCDLLF